MAPSSLATFHYGATPEDWAHFTLVLGLLHDLLPVVANPLAKISPDSSVKELGKTPTRYNRSGKVAGILDWANHQASAEDIERWLVQEDYGICLQTRLVRALDVDLPGHEQSLAIAQFLGQRLNELGVKLPMRMRSNSGKFLLAFTLPGEMGKRKMVVEGGIIEFLANGQQFIAVGTHQSGTRYEWVDGLPAAFPELTLEQFEQLWQNLVDTFAIEPPEGGSLNVRMKGASIALPDPVADHLRAQGLVLGIDRNGSVLVACPWEQDHTTGQAGDGSTVWFPAGTNGYQSGHFKCLHGHCTGRIDGDFFGAIGYQEDLSTDFSLVVVQPGTTPVSPALPPYTRDRTGNILATVNNVTMACLRPDLCGMEIRYDQFRDEIMFAQPDTGKWQPFTDSDYTRLRITLEGQGFKPVGRELIRDVVLLVAQDQPFDSAITWLGSMVWDGVPRVERFLEMYFGAEETPYARAVSMYLWTAMAGRVMKPGCKADMVPILVGEQGAGKSRAVAALAPSPEFFAEVSLHEKDDNLSRLMRGRLVAELGELRGLHSKELESIKAFITRTHENWIPKYREFAVQFPRRLVFIGTTNKDEFLADETGNRRWLPIRVQKTDPQAIERDRNQLWAEARDLFNLLGVDYRAAEQMSAASHKEYTIADSWNETVSKWLMEPDPLTGAKPIACKYLRVQEVLTKALRFEDRNITRREEMRMGAVLRALGYRRTKVREGKASVWGFVPGGDVLS